MRVQHLPGCAQGMAASPVATPPCAGARSRTPTAAAGKDNRKKAHAWLLASACRSFVWRFRSQFGPFAAIHGDTKFHTVEPKLLQHVSDNLDYAKTLVYVVHVGTHCTNVFISPWFHRRMHELLMWAAIAQMCSSALLVNTKTHCCVCGCVRLSCERAGRRHRASATLHKK